VAAFAMRAYLPTPRETNLLVFLGCASLGYALYLRHMVVDATTLELACAAGLPRASCFLRRAVVDFRDMELFGGVAIIAAAAHFIAPRFAAFAVAMCAGLFGLVLGNPEPSAMAGGLLILSFARPVRRLLASKPLPAPTAPSRTTTPANSRTSH
jgi:hypothetical protein